MLITPAVFREGSVKLDGVRNVWGFVGDVTQSRNDVTIKFCCQKKDPVDLPIELPNDTPFKLLSANECPVVKGENLIFNLSSFTDIVTCTRNGTQK